MKLAEVASGGSFSFDRDVPQSGEEDSGGNKPQQDDDAAAGTTAAATTTPASDDEEGGLHMGTPTKQQQNNNSSSSFDSPDSPKAAMTGESATTNGGLNVQGAQERGEDSNSLLSAGSEGALSMGGSSTKQREKLDPVVDVCPELEVKIADLGNACWVVSLTNTGHTLSLSVLSTRSSRFSFYVYNFFYQGSPLYRGHSDPAVSQSGGAPGCGLRSRGRHLVHRLHGLRDGHWRLSLRAPLGRRLLQR